MRYKCLRAFILSATAFLFTACGIENTAKIPTASIQANSTESVISKTDYAVTEPVDSETEYEYAATMYTLEDFPQYRSLVYSYNNLHPDRAIRIEVHDSPGAAGNSTYVLLVESLKGDNGPDLMILPISHIRSLWTSELIDPIDEILPPNIKSELIRGAVEYGSEDGHLIGLPCYIQEVKTCIVSSDYYSGKTWNFRDILNCMEEHPELERTFATRAEYNPDRYTLLLNLHMYDYDLSDPKFYDPKSKTVNFYNEDMVNLMENILRDSASAVKPTDYIKKGKYLAQYFETSDISALVNRMNLCCNGNTLVGFPVEEGPGTDISFADCLAVSKGSANKDIIEDFLNFAISPEGQLAMQKIVFEEGPFRPVMATPSVIPIRKDMGNYFKDISSFGISDPDKFIEVYEDFAENCGVLHSEEYIYDALESLSYYLTGYADPDAMAERLQTLFERKLLEQ